MTNNEAIKIIANFSDYIIPADEYGYLIQGELVEAHSMAVRALKLEEKQATSDKSNQWIPVTERLPDKMCQCICRYVFGENTEYPFYQVLWYFAVDEKPHFQNEGSMGLRVTHWMPLPEPPKED